MRIRRFVFVLVCFMLGMTALNAHHFQDTKGKTLADLQGGKE